MTARQELWDIAVDRFGYFTTKDAAALDIERLTVDKLVLRDKVERVAHGVYRFPELPATEYDPYMLAVLWTGVPEACLSHDTALAAYDVCDINPDRIHVTVAKTRRIRRQGGQRYEVHYADLGDDEVGWWHRIRTATLRTAIAQCVATGVPTYLLRQALQAGRARGALNAAEATRLTKTLEARDGR